MTTNYIINQDGCGEKFGIHQGNTGEIKFTTWEMVIFPISLVYLVVILISIFLNLSNI